MGTIVFVGAGSMAEAIIAGILKNEVMASKEVYVMNKSDDERLSYHAEIVWGFTRLSRTEGFAGMRN